MQVQKNHVACGQLELKVSLQMQLGFKANDLTQHMEVLRNKYPDLTA